MWHIMRNIYIVFANSNSVSEEQLLSRSGNVHTWATDSLPIR